MMIDPVTFETLIPSRFIAFTIPNLIKPSNDHHHHLHQDSLRIAVLDSPLQSANAFPSIAAMIVPPHRETDWIFSTESGHLQLLLHLPPQFSRLILIGNPPVSSHPTTYIRPSPVSPGHMEKLEEGLVPLLMALHPKSGFSKGLPEVPFLTYEDEVISSVVLDRFFGGFVGEFLVEDVELECTDKCERELRRRLRFKRMPNLIQTQLKIHLNPFINNNGSNDGLAGLVGLKESGKFEFIPDTGVLVHQYLIPMVAGLSLISLYLDERIQGGLTPKALCLGVGGGALLGFLNAQLGFEVVGVEADEVVLKVARQYFGLKDNGKSIRIILGDGIEWLEQFGDPNVGNSKDLTSSDKKFDAIMVDLDSSDATTGLSAPPLDFIKMSTLCAARCALHECGVVVINAIPQNESFYRALIQVLKKVFHELYEIDVGDGKNFVLLALASVGVPSMAATAKVTEDSFLTRLRSVISGAYMDSIMKI